MEQLVDHFIYQVSCGSQHSLAVSENGVAFSWGDGSVGALGTGRSSSQSEPVLVNFADPIACVAAGAQHTGFISKNGTLYMCGDGTMGQLGIGECVNVFSP